MIFRLNATRRYVSFLTPLSPLLSLLPALSSLGSLLYRLGSLLSPLCAPRSRSNPLVWCFHPSSGRAVRGIRAGSRPQCESS